MGEEDCNKLREEKQTLEEDAKTLAGKLLKAKEDMAKIQEKNSAERKTWLKEREEIEASMERERKTYKSDREKLMKSENIRMAVEAEKKLIEEKQNQEKALLQN